ncbi:monovalent cation/H(+) antiporter subunit G [Halorarius halobius]|uniref:monovalent cation/H(+) antiporter subunit G n=1 Tax=Halorarius halobius TaxID=2962671 RepID=UPI0020CDFC9F|nr:monovalent cation/H(+) antiporter subunit G [Halorarius halobius]
MTPGTLVALLLVAGGVGFVAVALVGLVRLPDCYSRAHATSKAETLGALLALAGAAVAFGDPAPALKLGLLALFLLVTGPAAAHAVVRSAHQQGVPAAAGTGTVDADDGGGGS